MNEPPFEPTLEQVKVIEHAGSAIIVACPGAGKTRVMIERARYVLRSPGNGRGIAFLLSRARPCRNWNTDCGGRYCSTHRFFPISLARSMASFGIFWWPLSGFRTPRLRPGLFLTRLVASSSPLRRLTRCLFPVLTGLPVRSTPLQRFAAGSM